MKKKRAILMVLDGVGLAALPDAKAYGDEDAATLPHVARACGGLNLPNLQRLGLGSLADIKGVPPLAAPIGAYGRLAEQSAGKDSIVGHWELTGVVVEKPFATYPQGFPAELVDAFSEVIGMRPLGNVSSGGISILKQYGAEHVRTGRPILYTSVDSVFQVAAHEEILSPSELYQLCQEARRLVDDYGIARVIARPFNGNEADGFRRTQRRKDFPVPPPQNTLLDCLSRQGLVVSAIGKIEDLFAGRGISRSVATIDNADGMHKTLAALEKLDEGVLAVNLIDFDMVYGHRKDATGFGRALESFDVWLPQLGQTMRKDDLLIITADHGCDPTTPGSDHTREYVPVLVWSKSMLSGMALGDRQSFADVGATLTEYFGVTGIAAGESFFDLLNLPA